MTIQIRVAEAQARKAIQQMQADIRRLEAQTRSAGAAMNTLGTGGLAGLGKWGSQVQWAGRQLTYNFSIPLAIAGAAATKWAFDNEAAMTRVTKVYGDLSMSQKQVNSETSALAKNFEALSSVYGVVQKDVINIGAEWAAAGASGVALAKSVRLTLDTMILGELDAADATEALIAIQAQYGLSIEDLSKSIDTLNMIENQTGTTMGDLITALSKSAGTARSAGIDLQHLGAMTAALVPAAGSAANAGNGLKTIISRLMAPTREAADMMALFGINTADMAWQSLNGAQRMEKLAQAYGSLADSQKVAVASTLVGRYQLNRVDILLKDMINTQGYYQKALNSSNDATANFAQKNKELQAVLSTAPARFKQMWVTLQNGMATAIQPLIPYILYLMSSVAKLATAFGQLDPELQKLIVFGAALLAIIGPLGRYVGATATLFMFLGEAAVFLGKALLAPIKLLWVLVKFPFGLIATAFGAVWGFIMTGGAGLIKWATAFGPRLLAAFTGPIGIAIAVILTLVAVFWDDIQNLFGQIVDGFQKNATGIADAFTPVVAFFNKIVDGIVKAFNRLPQGIQNAFKSVVQIVANAAKAVYRLFSYLNPFAHHSPSLVETVTWGMAEIRKQYASVGNVGGIFAKAASDLAKFKTVAASMNFDEWSDKRADVGSVMPSNLGNFDELVADWKILNQLAIAQKNDVNAAQIVVDQWKDKLDDANNALDIQQAILDKNKNSLDALTDSFDAHNNALKNYANTGITGMKAASDAAFANEMAVKALQLQIMDLEDAGGTSIEELANQMANLQGSMEALRGEANDLRASGAGSDVLGPIQDQLQQMQAAYDQMGDTAANSPINDLQKQLDALQRQGERLDLEHSIQFDPLTRQIDDLANGMAELPFDQIIAGINTERVAMEALNPQIAAAQATYDSQLATVNLLTAARDELNVSYQIEQANLQSLQDSYQTTADAIRDIESALNDMSSAARSSASGAGGGGGGGGLPAAADFADVGGSLGGLGREGGLEDQSAAIDELTRGLQEDLAKTFASLDMIGPIKRAWQKVVDWWTGNVTPAWNTLTSSLSDTFGSLDFSGFTTKFDEAKKGLSDFWAPISTGLGKVWDLIGPQLANIWANIQSAIGPALDSISEQLGPLWKDIKQFGGAIGDFLSGLWTWLQPVLAIIGVNLIAGLSMAFRMIANIIGPVIDWIGHIIAGIIQVIRGLIDILTGALQVVGGIFKTIIGLFKGLFTGDWSGFQAGLQMIWDGLQSLADGVTEIIGALWSAIIETIKGAAAVVWGLIAGFVQGIVDWFVWLWDVLVGHSIIPDMVNAIIDWFKKLWDDSVAFVRGMVDNIVSFFGNLYTSAVQWASNLVSGVVDWFSRLPGRAIAALGDFVGTLAQKGKDLLQGIINGIEFMWTALNNTLGGLPARILNGVGDVIGTLKDKGGDLIQGFINGITGKAGNIVAAIKSTITDKLPRFVKDALGIASPSKLFAWLGRMTGIGFANGLAGQTSDIANAAQDMVNAVANVSVPDLPIAQMAADMDAAQAKMNYASTAQNQTVVQHTENKYYNFYGSLEFPNVKDGDDAAEFLQNLNDLAGA